MNQNEQAQKIADICNQKGISRQELQTIINNFPK
jgi:hypothetical protein